jgi:hypothetical protein
LRAIEEGAAGEEQRELEGPQQEDRSSFAELVVRNGTAVTWALTPLYHHVVWN